ncbi:MAG: hypothetical protein ACFFAE_16970 [Candidatus Hodarchaeota archaeon]
MHTDEIIKIALDLVGMKELPIDSAVYIPGENISNILYGIDIGAAELLYAKEQGFDCVIAHHPVGLTNQFQVFQRHLGQLLSKGVPNETAQKVIEEKMVGFKFGSHARNYDAVPSFARLIGMPFLNIHCPSDEFGRRLITRSIEELEIHQENLLLHEVITHLEKSFSEFRKAQTKIEVAKGNGSDPLGNWIFSHGAFTNGGFTIADTYYQHDVDTVIYIHIAPTELFKVLNLTYGQLLITGHLASDSIGINPFLDRLEEKGIQITAVGGLIR